MNYQTPTEIASLKAWGDVRETHVAVAAAIFAICDRKRTAEAIWEAPTPAEWDHVAMAVEEYVNNDIFDREPDGEYAWGQETVRVPVAA